VSADSKRDVDSLPAEMMVADSTARMQKDSMDLKNKDYQ
jgi:hypothetical protein